MGRSNSIKEFNRLTGFEHTSERYSRVRFCDFIRLDLSLVWFGLFRFVVVFFCFCSSLDILLFVVLGYVSRVMLNQCILIHCNFLTFL